MLLALLPEGRFLIFVNRDEADQSDGPPSAADLAALLNARVGADVGLSDLRWVSYFQMHKRVVPALSDGRRFLLGDAGHLSSPMGGEGINSALMDSANIAWKLALVLRGAAKPSLLDSYAIERGLADRHVLEVSNEIHGSVMQLVEKCRAGEPLSCRRRIQPRRSRACASARCSTYRTRAAFSSSEALATRSLRPERAFRAGAISREPRITWFFPAARHGWTISARDGTASCRSWTGRERTPREAGRAGGWGRCPGPPGWLHRLPARRGGWKCDQGARRASLDLSPSQLAARWTDQVHRSQAAIDGGLKTL